MMKLETDRKIIQDSLDAQKTQAERNVLGQFSTPFPLAVDIMKYAKENTVTDSISFLEPAIGTGVFYSAFLHVFGENVSHTALGFEIDPHYYNPTKEFWKNSALEIKNADFLEQQPEKKYSLLVANPPYSRHHHIKSDKKKYLQEMVFLHTGIRISGLAGLYCYFLMLSTRWLKENALSCWLIPSEFMDVNFGKALKEYLLNNVDLIQIHSFSPRRFAIFRCFNYFIYRCF
ncbi:MAG: Eco57I restriction-modification methylase domain-containing protein [Victivallaceae bacterium]|nr:Eco57I restriction-modification methylase domain-containing protein [Victivallaceae bacterium]